MRPPRSNPCPRPALLGAALLGAALFTGCSSSPPITEVGSSSGATTGGGGGNVSSTAAQVSTTEDSLLTTLFASDFTSVCQGATVSKATPYDAAKPTHKVIYLAPYGDGDLIEQVTVLPDDWKVTFDPNSDAYAAVDLVACAERLDETFVKECDGYEKDDKPTENKVKVHTANYKVTVREATTGKELANKTIASEEADCPMFQMFEGTSDVVNSYAAVPEAELVSMLKPYVQP